MAAGYAPRAEPMLTQRQRWSDVEPMTGIEPAYSLGSRFWVRTGILNRQLRVPIESLIFPAQVWFGTSARRTRYRGRYGSGSVGSGVPNRY
jgi:hypothetical protein